MKKQRIKVELYNDYHGTKCTVYCTPSVFDAALLIDKRQIRSAWKKLCGNISCNCWCNQAGMSGKDNPEIVFGTDVVTIYLKEKLKC